MNDVSRSITPEGFVTFGEFGLEKYTESKETISGNELDYRIKMLIDGKVSVSAYGSIFSN